MGIFAKFQGTHLSDPVSTLFSLCKWAPHVIPNLTPPNPHHGRTAPNLIALPLYRSRCHPSTRSRLHPLRPLPAPAVPAAGQASPVGIWQTERLTVTFPSTPPPWPSSSELLRSVMSPAFPCTEQVGRVARARAAGRRPRGHTAGMGGSDQLGSLLAWVAAAGQGDALRDAREWEAGGARAARSVAGVGLGRRRG
jgi:hypothetical protein